MLPLKIHTFTYFPLYYSDSSVFDHVISSPDSTAKTADSGIESLAKRLSEDTILGSSVGSSPLPPTTGNDQVDHALVYHLVYCERLLEVRISHSCLEVCIHIHFGEFLFFFLQLCTFSCFMGFFFHTSYRYFKLRTPHLINFKLCLEAYHCTKIPVFLPKYLIYKKS